MTRTSLLGLVAAALIAAPAIAHLDVEQHGDAATGQSPTHQHTAHQRTSHQHASDGMKTFQVGNGVLIIAQTVVPAAEKERAQELLADGPTETTGIASVEKIGSVSLDGEFKSSDGLMMRVRELVIEPGGIVAVHQHTNRPGAAYIIEGEMTEHRSSESGPVVKKAGSTAMERSGVVHWWENTGSIPARALVVDIIAAQ
jgi:quercetin dioxygenase-like cupin family protein